MYKQHPRLTLIEVGPGAIDLITLRGLRVLRNADVILYDASVNEVLLLENAPEKAVKVFIGKRRNAAAFSPEDVNEIIVQYAETYGHVVQLKGGGALPATHETDTIRYAQARGLITEYVPGVPDIAAIQKMIMLTAYSKN